MSILRELFRESEGLFFPIALANCLRHLCLAIGVYREASDRVVLGRKLWFIRAGVWAIATGIGGVFVAATYGVMHHSTPGLAETADPDEDWESLAEKFPANQRSGN